MTREASSLIDWETGNVVLAIVIDPLMAVTVDLVADEDVGPTVIHLSRTVTPADDRERLMT
jgi:hypothetical protein